MLYNYQNKKRTYCKCLGIDNKEYIVRQDALVSGATRNIKGVCKTGKFKDISGKRYGRLVAIRPTEKRDSNGGIIWECLCDCGNYAYQNSSILERGHAISCGCAKTDFIESCKSDIIGKRFGLLTVVAEYKPNVKLKRRKVICDCDCGNIHICAVTDLNSGHTMSCGCLSKSKGELLIEELLVNSNIEFVKQKRFPGCKNKKHLPFDFYLPKQNTCIEYDGEQHFKPIKYWGGEEKLKIYQLNDKIKTDYCLKNDIKLVRIDYTRTKEEIIKIIQDLISPATITA